MKLSDRINELATAIGADIKTIQGYFSSGNMQFGVGGPRIKNIAGVLTARNAADNAISSLQANLIGNISNGLLYYSPISGRRYYQFLHGSGNLSTVTLTSIAGNLLAHAIPIIQDITVAALALYVTVANSSNVRVGLYSDNSGYPGTLIEDCGEISVSTIGLKRLPFSSPRVLHAGLYWVCYTTNATGGSIRGLALASIMNILGADIVNGQTYNSIMITQSYGALPNTFPSSAVTSASNQSITIEIN